MSTNPPPAPPARQERSWLYNHIGRLAGLVLAVIAIGFIALLAVVGFRPAEGLLVFLAAVLIMIALGGRLHGL